VGDEGERARRERAERLREEIARLKSKKKGRDERPKPRTPRDYVEEEMRRPTEDGEPEEDGGEDSG
jgi:hypothetical protein